MACEHKQLRCTNNTFYCLKCGAVVRSPFEAGNNTPVAETAPEAPKKAVKRTTRKKGE